MKKHLLIVFFAGIAIFNPSCKSSPSDAANDSNGGDNALTVTDADGNAYHIVTIGTQTWTVENLKTTKFNDGTPIPLVTDSIAWKSLKTPGYCWYDNDANANGNVYGAIYNWYAVNTGKLAPAGWHVPTEADWKTLELYLIANGYNWDGTTTGNKIAKSLSAKTNWEACSDSGAVGNDLSANDRTGFNGLPAGCRYDGWFKGLGTWTRWWSSSLGDDPDEAVGRFYGSSSENLNGDDDFPQSYGLSVKLVRD